MTVVAAVCCDDGVWMGADKNTTDEFGRKGSGITISGKLVTDKVNAVCLPNEEQLVWAGAGLWYVSQLLRMEWQPGEPPDSDWHDSVHEWLWNESKAMWKLFSRKHVWQRIEDEETPGLVDFDMLIGFRKNLWYMDSAGGVDMVPDDFCAIGSGSLPAAGALYATKGLLDPQRRVVMALRSSQHHDYQVRDPFDIKFAPAEQ